MSARAPAPGRQRLLEPSTWRAVTGHQITEATRAGSCERELRAVSVCAHETVTDAARALSPVSPALKREPPAGGPRVEGTDRRAAGRALRLTLGLRRGLGRGGLGGR